VAIRAALATARAHYAAGKPAPRPEYSRADVIERTKAGTQPKTRNDRWRRIVSTLYVDPFMQISTLSARTRIPRSALCRYLAELRRLGHLQTVKNQQHHGDPRNRRTGAYILHPYCIALAGLDAREYRRRVKATGGVLRSVRGLDGKKNARAWRAFCRRSSLLCLWLGIRFFSDSKKQNPMESEVDPNNSNPPILKDRGVACSVSDNRAGAVVENGDGGNGTADAGKKRKGQNQNRVTGGLSWTRLCALLADPVALALAAAGVRTAPGREKIRARIGEQRAQALATRCAAGVVDALAELLAYAGRQEQADRQDIASTVRSVETHGLPTVDDLKKLSDAQIAQWRAKLDAIADNAYQIGDYTQRQTIDAMVIAIAREDNERRARRMGAPDSDKMRPITRAEWERKKLLTEICNLMRDKTDPARLARLLDAVRSMPADACPVRSRWARRAARGDERAATAVRWLDGIYNSPTTNR